MQKKDISVGISINKGCNTTYSPGERILISCSATADCVAELKLTYPDWSSKILMSNQVLRQGRNLILERKVPNTSGTYTLTLYGRTPFGVRQDDCSYSCESTGSLRVESNIEGTDICVDRAYCGCSPVHIENISAGTHEICVTKSGYHEWKSKIVVQEGLSTAVRAILTKEDEPLSETGSVFARSEPNGAEVYLDGTIRGETPLLIEEIPAGIHTFKVAREGFSDFDQVVNIISGKPIFVSANLCRRHGCIQVFTSISGAEVYLDGECQGMAPLTIYNVPEGDHVVALVKWGYELWSSSLLVKADETVDVYPNVSLLWMWYILAAIGIPFYRLREALQNLRKKDELPPYVPELSHSNVVVTSEIASEPEPVLLCPFCNQELHIYVDEILECLFCEKEGLSCRFHKLCWTKWVEQTGGKRKCMLYPAFVSIPIQKIRVVKRESWVRG